MTVPVPVSDRWIDAGGGRRLQVQSAPENAGYPLLVHHGSPAARLLFAPNVDAAAGHGFRLISWDRPGYGDTPGMPGRRVADGAPEAAAVADALECDRFAVWGFSGGGSFALACAALLPDRVSGTVVMATLAPYAAEGLDWAGHFSEAGQAEVRLYFENREQARENFRVDAERYASRATVEGWLEVWGERAEADEAHSRAVAEHLARVWRESEKQSDEGWWEDWEAYLSPWGFDLGGIRTPVQLWHGVHDAAASVEHGRWLANRIPGVDAHFVDEDHTNIEMNHQDEAWSWLRGHAGS